MKKRFIIGLAISCVVLFLLFRLISWKEVYSQIRSANIFLIALAAALNFITVGARILRWHILLRSIGSVGFGDVFRSYMGGLAISCVVPFRLGEAYRAHAISSSTKARITGAVSTILADRSFDAISFGVIVLVAAYFLPFPEDVASKTYATAFASIALVASFPLVSIFRKNISRSNRTANSRILRWLESLLRSYGTISAPQAVWCSLLSIASWVAQIAVTSIVCLSAGLRIPPGGAALIVIAINLAMAVPVTPAAIGVFQVAFLFAAAPYGLDKQTAMAAATILQITLVVPVLAVGILVLNRDLIWNSNQTRV